MTLAEQAIHQLEEENEKVKAVIGLRDKIIKLFDNKEFKEVILEEFMKTDAARLAEISQDPTLDEKEQRDAMNMLAAPGHLKRWLNVRLLQGDTAQRQIEHNNEQIEDIRVNGYLNEGDE